MMLSTATHNDIEKNLKEGLLAQDEPREGRQKTMNHRKIMIKLMTVAMALLCVGMACLTFHCQPKPMALKLQPLRSEKDMGYIALADHDVGELKALRLEDNNEHLDFPPIPPIHPKHTAHVHYSSTMDPNGKIQYRRDVTLPCEHGVLLFSVGVAKDNLPYKYEIYNDAYLYSNNGGLCILNPTYGAYQLSDEPLKNPDDPEDINLKDLDVHKMHWISGKVRNPYRAKRSFDKTKTGDYVIIAKHDFYTTHFYEALKSTINNWE